MPALDPLIYACIGLSAAEVVAAILFLYAFRTMSHTRYSAGLRISCVLVIPIAITQTAVPLSPILQGDPHRTVGFTMLLYSVVSSFALTQLEFLKTLAALFSTITDSAIVKAQIFVGVASIAYIASPLLFLMLYSSDMTILTIASAAWSGLVGLYDLGQQSLLLFCVLRRLPGVSIGFRVGYMALTVFGCSMMFLGISLASRKRSLPQTALMNLVIPAFGLCSFAAMETFRVALYRVKRPSVKPAKAAKAAKPDQNTKAPRMNTVSRLIQSREVSSRPTPTPTVELGMSPGGPTPTLFPQ
ncbi:hypothetical protein BC831DRAFT_458540 [Entophlyctis helioformis]|nr:hypothetical protein BC831DRAFT_458540 [Entophlyctis helioformis]